MAVASVTMTAMATASGSVECSGLAWARVRAQVMGQGSEKVTAVASVTMTAVATASGSAEGLEQVLAMAWALA